MGKKVEINGEKYKPGEAIAYTKADKSTSINCILVKEITSPKGVQLLYIQENGRKTTFFVKELDYDRLVKPQNIPEVAEGPSRKEKLAAFLKKLKPNRSKKPRTRQEEPEEPEEYSSETSSQNESTNNNYSHPTEKTSKFMSEVLMLFVLIAHAIDIFRLKGSIDPGTIGVRIFIYLALVIATITIAGNFNDLKREFLKYAGIAAIPALLIPIIAHLARTLGATDEITTRIAGLALLLPFYAFYLLKNPNLDYTLLGKTRTQRFFSAFILPSGLLRIYLAILIIALLSQLLVASSSMADDASAGLGISGSGFAPGEVLRGAGEILISPIQRLVDFIKGIGPSVGGNYTKLYNDSLGQYYTGEVEQNKELTGVFIDQLRTMGTYFEGTPVELFAVIKMRSFVDEINMTTSCIAQNAQNRSIVILGRTNPEKVTNIFRDDYIGVSCIFDGENSLPKGRYDVLFSSEFNFETWAYSTLTFMDRQFLTSLYAQGVDVRTRYNIQPRIRTIYTNGPIMLGMNEGMEMPIALSTNPDHTNRLYLGLTLDDRLQVGTRGEVRTVNKFQLRLPAEFKITNETCMLPPGTTMTTERESEELVPGYLVHTFDATKNPGKYLSISCNAEITPSNAGILLSDPSGIQAITIAGTAKYDYVLSRRADIEVK
jgi:hypothetical protein